MSRHRALAERGYFLAGNRILLSEAFTAAVLARPRAPSIDGPRRSGWSPGCAATSIARCRSCACPTALFASAPRRWEGVKTCNFSAWRADLVRANGFDERYSGWGLEDSDLVIRLLHAGVRHKSARFAAPVFHLWHRENDRSRLAENQHRLDEILASDRVWPLVGLDQYS